MNEVPSSEITAEHRYPWRAQEITIIAALLVIPALIGLKSEWALAHLTPACAALALYLLWVGWSRKHRSTVRLVLTGDAVRVSYPYTRNPRRARPVEARLDEVTGATLPLREGLPGDDLRLVIGEDKSALVPLRVVSPMIAEALLDEGVVSANCGRAYEKLVELAGREPALVAISAHSEDE